MILLRVAAFGTLLFMSSCMAQQRPVLGSAVVASLNFTEYGQVEQSSLGLVIAYSCTEKKCNVDHFFEFKGPWPSGTYCVMYDSSQVAFYTVEIKDGKKHGVERYYYANGNLMRQRQYAGGARVALSFDFFPSGQLERLNGSDPKGNVVSICSFGEDQRSGTVHHMVDGAGVSQDWKLVGDTAVIIGPPIR